MKKLLFLGITAALFWACNNDDETFSGKPENDVDAARIFIRDALDGKYKEARTLLLPDSTNVQLLEISEGKYLQMDAPTQRGYRESSIRVYETKKLNDSTTIVVYSNSFKNQKDSVKAVRLGNEWLIDLKYSFPQTRLTQ